MTLVGAVTFAALYILALSGIAEWNARRPFMDYCA